MSKVIYFFVFIGCFVSSRLMATEVIRLSHGVSHNIATWAFPSIEPNDVKLAVGIGSVTVNQFNQQLIISYHAPALATSAVEQIFIVARDRLGEVHARHVATVVLGHPKATDFGVTTICVGHETWLPVLAGHASRSFLTLQLNAVYAERPSDLEVALSGMDGKYRDFVKIKPLVAGSHNIMMITKNNNLRTGRVIAIDCP